MQNSSNYRFSIGGVVFELNGPEFTPKENLMKFAVGEACADESYSLVIGECPGDPAGMSPVYSNKLRRVYDTENGRITVFTDNVTGETYMTDVRTGNRHEAVLSENRTDYVGTNLAMLLMDIPEAVIRHGGVFLHSSFVDVGGEAVLFTGAKQVGKSTQAALWEKYRGAETVNGDRALLRKKDGKWYAWGSPYCGTSDICKNVSLPLRAVVILSKAKESTAGKADAKKALAALLDGCSFDTWDKTAVSGVLELCSSIVTDIPFYSLSCLPDESAVTALEKVL